MALKDLSAADVDTVRRCLEYLIQSRELEGEFQSRMGVTEAGVRHLLSEWPAVNDASDNSTDCLAINNALNEVVHGIRFSNEEWERWFPVTPSQVAATYERWARSRGWGRTGIM